MIFNISGGGGAALNFKVLQYQTEEELLAATPMENTIGVVTDIPITSWIFSSTEPTPAVPGMVWFGTDRASNVDFNALKKNTLQVYPIHAKQYVNNEWINRTTYSRHGGKWVIWIKQLVFDLNADKWITVSGKNFSHSLSNNEDGALILSTSKQSEVATYYSARCYVDPVDLSDYDKLVVNLKWEKLSGNAWGEVYFSQTSNGSATVKFNSLDSTSGDKVIDVSSLSGEYYLCIMVQLGASGKGRMTINSAMLTEVL